MPLYISHAIMGNSLYEEANKDEKLFKLPINVHSLRGYSQGMDFATFSNPNAHSNKTQEFLLTLIQYIKENDLTEDSEVLAFLYGHISHYFFDTKAHPLIYYIEQGCQKVGMFTPHNLVEGYIDTYLIRNIMHKERVQINEHFFNQIDLKNPVIIKLIKDVHYKTYQDKNIMKSTYLTLFLSSLIEIVSKSPMMTENFLIWLSSFQKFLEVNQLTKEEIVNSNNDTWKVPTTGEKHQESFLQIYQDALSTTLEAMNEVNKYLYNVKSISSLEKVFPDISYDTGCPLSLGLEMKHIRGMDNNTKAYQFKK